MVHLHNVRHVHAHTECFGADHHNCLVVLESILCSVLFSPFHTCVVTADFILYTERYRLINAVHRRTERAVDQCLFAFCHIFCDLLRHMVHLKLITALIRLLVQRVNIKVDVIAADTAQIQDGLIQSQRADGVLHHVIPATKHSRCRQAEHREVQSIFALALQIIAHEPVVRTEIPAPAGDGVSFVHHEQAQSAAA